jgi:hypothetical protein
MVEVMGKWFQAAWNSAFLHVICIGSEHFSAIAAHMWKSKF